MSAPVVDAEAVRAFLDKAEPFFDADYLGGLAAALEERTRAVRSGAVAWERWWSLPPVCRRIPADERRRWAELMAPWVEALQAGEAQPVLHAVQDLPARPPWLLDWCTYWLAAAAPESNPWWARWVFRPEHKTGALLLVLAEPGDLVGTTLTETYGRMQSAQRFLGEVLASMGRLKAVLDRHRPLVALASVYAVYLFTMAAWRMTDEFTRVLPPFPAVVRSLLGLTRWEEA